jgi:hypothetical protein
MKKMTRDCRFDAKQKLETAYQIGPRFRAPANDSHTAGGEKNKDGRKNVKMHIPAGNNLSHEIGDRERYRPCSVWVV